MTEEETARFALVLRECERIRAMIAEDEAAPPPAVWMYPDPAVVAA